MTVNPMSIECPHCHEPPGKMCTQPSGFVAMRTHKQRRDAAAAKAAPLHAPPAQSPVPPKTPWEK